MRMTGERHPFQHREVLLRGGPEEPGSKNGSRGRGPIVVHGWPEDADAEGGGTARTKLAKENALLEGKGHQFVWIVDCPMFQADAVTGKLTSFHHPLVRPVKGDIDETEDPMKIKGLSYDLVLDGSEIASGSMRNHDPSSSARCSISWERTRSEIGKRVRFLP